MCTKVKKLGANMLKQVAFVLRPFFDFMDCFKLYKVHNMVVLMFDPRFKDLSLVRKYIGQFSTIGIVVAYDVATLVLGLRPRQKGCKVVARGSPGAKVRGSPGVKARGSPGVTSHTPGSVRKCEGVNPHTPKATPILGDGVSVDS